MRAFFKLPDGDSIHIEADAYHICKDCVRIGVQKGAAHHSIELPGLATLFLARQLCHWLKHTQPDSVRGIIDILERGTPPDADQ